MSASFYEKYAHILVSSVLVGYYSVWDVDEPYLFIPNLVYWNFYHLLVLRIYSFKEYVSMQTYKQWAKTGEGNECWCIRFTFHKTFTLNRLYSNQILKNLYSIVNPISNLPTHHRNSKLIYQNKQENVSKFTHFPSI